MSETRTSPGPEGPALQDKKLVSWKEIASHLGREVRTVQRWSARRASRCGHLPVAGTVAGEHC